MKPQRPHDRQSSVVTLSNGGVEIWHQLRTQLEVLPADRLDLFVLQLLGRGSPFAVREGPAVSTVPSPRQPEVPVAAVRAEERIERAELEPPYMELAGVLVGRVETADVGAPVRQA